MTVTIDGSQVTLSTDGGTTITGTLGNGTLTVTGQPDQSAGEITTGVFYSSDAAAYNAAVRKLDKIIAGDNAHAQENVSYDATENVE